MSELGKNAVNVALIGAGTVGGGTLNVLTHNADIITARALPIHVRWVAALTEEEGRTAIEKVGATDVRVTTNWREAVSDPDVDIVVELIGGTTVARDIISTALKAGKSAVTANKDLMATHGGELLAIAAEHQTDLFFEASVGGGIPIIQALKENLAGNNFNEIIGIVNGTTNYILTKMSETGADFADALKQAQDLGYAEADPTSDVEGKDAGRKMAILSSIAFNSRVTFDMVECQGITKISTHDIQYAKENGYVIKMLGVARCDGQAIDVRVHPVLLPITHPLASVRDSYNAVFVNGDALENAMFYGRGAGSLPTGSAVVGDIIAAARNIAHSCKARYGCTCHKSLSVLPIGETVSKYYLRMQVDDATGVFASLAQILADNDISMDTIMQRRSLADNGAEIVMITHPAKFANFKMVLKQINELSFVREISNYIRVEQDVQ